MFLESAFTRSTLPAGARSLSYLVTVGPGAGGPRRRGNRRAEGHRRARRGVLGDRAIGAGRRRPSVLAAAGPALGQDPAQQRRVVRPVVRACLDGLLPLAPAPAQLAAGAPGPTGLSPFGLARPARAGPHEATPLRPPAPHPGQRGSG